MKKTKKIKIVFVLMAVCFLFVQTAGATPQCEITAEKGAKVDLNRVSECFENRFGYDKDTMRRFNKKREVPTTEIHFDKTDPKVGEKVTAIASPKVFKNASENLYFTWYLLRTDPVTGTPLLGESIEGAKKRAMGIVARGEYDPDLFDQDYTAAVDNDDDGFFASFGGADGVGAKKGEGVGEWDDDEDVMCDADKQLVNSAEITRCYRHNFGIKVYDVDDDWSNDDNRAGRDKIVRCRHEFPRCGSFVVGDGSFDIEEEECWKLDPLNSDTDGDGIEDEADLAGLNQQQFTWKYREGDHVGVVIEGTSIIPINEGCTTVEHEFLGYNVEGSGPYADLDAAYDICDNYLASSVSVSGSWGGGGGGGSAISMSVDLDAFNQGMVDYEVCLESIEETWGEETDTEGALNAYYKIMWATTGICGREANGTGSRGFIVDDHCGNASGGGEGDIGFNHLSVVPVGLAGKQILDPELNYIPENAQFDATATTPEDSMTDIITVSATTNNDNVDDDFLFYRWIVGRCNGDDVLDCENDLSNSLAGAGEYVFESFEEGLGVKYLKFSPTASIFDIDDNGTPDVDKVFLEATVIESLHSDLIGGEAEDDRGFDVGAVEKIIIPVMRNNVALKLYQTDLVAGSFVQGAEICNGASPETSTYRQLCPVYGYQTIAAQAFVAGGGVGCDFFAWQINGQPLEIPFDTTIFPGADTLSNTIFLPMQGFNKSLQDISVTCKKTGKITDLVMGRKLSVNNPVAVIKTNDGIATPIVKYDGTDSLNIFEATRGATVTFRAEIVPAYLTINFAATLEEDLNGTGIVLGDNEVHLMWYLNGEFVDASAIGGDLNINVAGDTISFTVDSNMTYGEGYDLTARIEKKFDSTHVDALKNGWKILNTHTLTNDKSITLRPKIPLGGVQNPTFKEYFASSLSNAPRYLIFSIRLGIAMVLVWFILFGLSYAIRLNKKI